MTTLSTEERREVVNVLHALADLARFTTRPSEAPDVCRALLDIEGIARTEARKLEKSGP